jgi:hypothetical protein
LQHDNHRDNSNGANRDGPTDAKEDYRVSAFGRRAGMICLTWRQPQGCLRIDQRWFSLAHGFKYCSVLEAELQ